jgi:hypothetical protein
MAIDFKFPKPEATTVPTVPVNKLMACTAFNEATGAGAGSTTASYNASFTENDVVLDSISVLNLARWIRAYYDKQKEENVQP